MLWYVLCLVWKEKQRKGKKEWKVTKAKKVKYRIKIFSFNNFIFYYWKNDKLTKKLYYIVSIYCLFISFVYVFEINSKTKFKLL